jgi:GNAT superfamily N-acetyltransferase
MTDSVHQAKTAETTAWSETLRDGTLVRIRPIQGEDAGLERRFLETLSPESRESRFLGQVNVTDEMLRRAANVDPQSGVALIAVLPGLAGDTEIGVGRFCMDGDRATCECAIVVSDEWQGRGLGYSLMRHLIEIARERGIRRMYSIDATANHKMRDLAAACGFERVVHPSYPGEVIHSLRL